MSSVAANKVTNILVVGVGGQGIILAGEILADVALNAGFDIKKSEIHGMAQRGGSVNSQVRFGKQVFSPVIPRGEADILLSFEKLEPLRWIEYCNAKTVAIVNDHSIHSLTTATGLQRYPDNVEDELNARFGNLFLIPAQDIAENIGNPRVVNVVLLGLMASMLDFDKENWLDALKKRLKPKFIDINLKAFESGYTFFSE